MKTEEIRKQIMTEWARSGGRARWKNVKKRGPKLNDKNREALARANKRKSLIRWPSFNLTCAVCHKALEKHRAGAAQRSLKKHGSHKVACGKCAAKLDAKLANPGEIIDGVA